MHRLQRVAQDPLGFYVWYKFGEGPPGQPNQEFEPPTPIHGASISLRDIADIRRRAPAETASALAALRLLAAAGVSDSQ